MKNKYIEEKLAWLWQMIEANIDRPTPSSTHNIKQGIRLAIKQTRLDTIKEIEGVVKTEWGSYNNGCGCCMDSDVEREINEVFNKLKE